jgi:hypothetical protein
MHSCVILGDRVLIDCGADCLGKLKRLRPRAIVLAHAHPDHAGGLKHGAPCPVYATAETWHRFETISDPRARDDHPAKASQNWQPHLRGLFGPALIDCPGRWLSHHVRRRCYIYVPDLVSTQERHEVRTGIQLYVGDGSSLIRPMLRRRHGALIGHASVRDQLDWCRDEGVSRAVITHCGSQIVKADVITASPDRGARTRASTAGTNCIRWFALDRTTLEAVSFADMNQRCVFVRKIAESVISPAPPTRSLIRQVCSTIPRASLTWRTGQSILAAPSVRRRPREGLF